MTTILAEYRDRPRRHLLRLLAEREINFADFALECGMASPPTTWSSGRSQDAEHRERARMALRHYTHGKSPREPGSALICRWAEVLGVDPGVFRQADGASQAGAGNPRPA